MLPGRHVELASVLPRNTRQVPCHVTCYLHASGVKGHHLCQLVPCLQPPLAEPGSAFSQLCSGFRGSAHTRHIGHDLPSPENSSCWWKWVRNSLARCESPECSYPFSCHLDTPSPPKKPRSSHLALNLLLLGTVF